MDSKEDREVKIEKNYIQARGFTSSAISAIISDKKHLDHTIIRTGDAVEWFDLEKALLKFREKVDWIYVGSLKKGSVEKVGKIIEFAIKKKAKLCFAPSSYQIKNDIKELSRYFTKFELVFLNRDEAIEILQNLKIDFKDDPVELLRKIRELGFKKVVLTDGAEGAYVTDGQERFYLEIVDGEKIETVGAGDSFASGFLNAYIEEENIKKGLAWGMVNSGAVLAKIGATKGLLNRKELKVKGEKIFNKIKEFPSNKIKL